MVYMCIAGFKDGWVDRRKRMSPMGAYKIILSKITCILNLTMSCEATSMHHKGATQVQLA